MRYSFSSREIQPGDAAYIVDGQSDGYSPVIVVRVNKITVTVRTMFGTYRLNLAADRNNVALSFAGNDEDDRHETIRKNLSEIR